jgi:hypothetical protein
MITFFIPNASHLGYRRTQAEIPLDDAIAMAKSRRGICCNARRQILADFTTASPRGLRFLPTPLPLPSKQFFTSERAVH